MALELRVDTDLQAALPAEIGFNFDELKTELAERLDHYNNLIVTEDGIKEAKDDRAKLNKLRTAIDTRRKDIKREYMKPYNEFEGKIKELTLLIDDPIKAIDTQLNGYEEKRKAEKMKEIEEIYEAAVHDAFHSIIPLERILDSRWLNKTYREEQIKDDIHAWTRRVGADLRVLDTVEPEYMAAVKEKYIETLDIDAAMNHLDRLKEAQEAFRAREEEKRRREEAMIAQREKRAAEAKSEPQTQASMPEAPAEPEEPTYILRLELKVTKMQAKALRACIDINEIEYRKI